MSHPLTPIPTAGKKRHLTLTKLRQAEKHVWILDQIVLNIVIRVGKILFGSVVKQKMA